MVVLKSIKSGGGTSVIAGLSDVTITSVGDNDILAYDNGSSEWINQTPTEAGLAEASHVHDASDVTSGTFLDARIAESNITQHEAALSITESQISDLDHYDSTDFDTDFAAKGVDDLSDADTTTSTPSLNQVLKWDGSNWVPGTAGDTDEFTFSIDSFSDGISDTNQLIGSGTWRGVGAITFTATYSNAPGGMTAEVAMSGANNAWSGNLSMTPVEGPETNTEIVEYPSSAGGTVTFTLSQSADGTTDTESVSFNNTMRYGNSTLTQGNQTEASLEALTEVSGPNESRNQTINNISTTANYLVFAYADRLSDVQQVRRNSGFGMATASFNSTRTTVAPSVQTGVSNVDNSAGYSETFACITSTDTGLADGGDDFQLLTSTSPQNYIYWGELALDAGGDGGNVYDQDNVKDNTASEPGQISSNSMSSRDMTVNATGSEYTYIAYPARLGALTSIVIGGFESIGDFWIDANSGNELTVQNDAGFEEDYYVYVSKNPGFTDPTTMTVSI